MTRAAIVVLVVVLVLGGLFFVLRPDTPAGGPRDRTFDVSVKDGEMNPTEISVNEGDSGDAPRQLRQTDGTPRARLRRGAGGRTGQEADVHFKADLTGRFEIEDHESEKEARRAPGSPAVMPEGASAASPG